MLKAVIFDCWHTVFYKDVVKSPYTQIAERMGLVRDYDFVKILEKSLELEKITAEELPLKLKNLLNDFRIDSETGLVRDLTEILCMDLAGYYKPCPGALETLETLKAQGLLLGLISNSSNIEFDPLENNLGLKDIFDALIVSYRVGLLKPDPRIFELALAKLNVEAGEALMVGDTLQDDILPAQKLGMKTLLYDTRHRYPEYPERIFSLSDIPNLIKKYE